MVDRAAEAERTRQEHAAAVIEERERARAEERTRATAAAKAEDERRRSQGWVRVMVPSASRFDGKPGQTVWQDGVPYCLVEPRKMRIESEDCCVYGLMPERDGWYITGWAKPLPAEETARLVAGALARQERAETKRRAERAIGSAFADAWRNGAYLERAEPEGETVFSDETVYDGGGSILVDRDGGAIWCVRRNGGDGDDWSLNNCRRGMAFRIPYSEDEDARIRNLVADLGDGPAPCEEGGTVIVP